MAERLTSCASFIWEIRSLFSSLVRAAVSLGESIDLSMLSFSLSFSSFSYETQKSVVKCFKVMVLEREKALQAQYLFFRGAGFFSGSIHWFSSNIILHVNPVPQLARKS
jgi:hypothetical protein